MGTPLLTILLYLDKLNGLLHTNNKEVVCWNCFKKGYELSKTILLLILWMLLWYYFVI